MHAFFVFLLGITNIFGLKRISFKKNGAKSLSLSNNDYSQDLDMLHKFKNSFDKESYNDMIQDIMNNKISKILINTDYKQLVGVDNLPKEDSFYTYNHYHLVDINPIMVPNLVEKTSDLHIPLYFVNFTPDSIANLENVFNNLVGAFGILIPIFAVISIISFFRAFSNPSAKMNIRPGGLGNSPNQPFSDLFGGVKNEIEFTKPNVSMESWAGSPEVISECEEVISYLENKEKYKSIGAEMPRGILLEGPPGTGKTLLAKAIATETNSTFISMSGSEFVELFVGMGASRVRELFETARKERPCIIFIDEIDAVGRQRGAGINMANDEREQTLNQLLYEMDGFNNNEDILVMAATNRKDILDKALLRPGRFDRIIRVSLPDKESREKILSYYLKTKKLEKVFDVSAISELTEGFSGAQLKNLINEAAILSIRNNYTVIQEKYVFDAFEKAIVGLIRTNATVSPSTKERVAIHESGHTLLALKFRQYFEFQKVSIQPTYNGAGGYTIFREKPEIREGGLYTKDILKKRLIVTMGGKAAESIYYGNDHVSLGAVQDLKQANSLAKKMIGNYGMGDELEVFFNEDINDDSNLFLGKSLGTSDKYSQHTRYVMDQESLGLVKEAYAEAKAILAKNHETLIEFSHLLQTNTILYKKEVEDFYL